VQNSEGDSESTGAGANDACALINEVKPIIEIERHRIAPLLRCFSRVRPVKGATCSLALRLPLYLGLRTDVLSGSSHADLPAQGFHKPIIERLGFGEVDAVRY
jgi:hypothetical protein